jgi:hypothetical protein
MRYRYILNRAPAHGFAETAEAFDTAEEAALERSIDPLAGMEAGDSAESAAIAADEEAE